MISIGVINIFHILSGGRCLVVIKILLSWELRTVVGSIHRAQVDREVINLKPHISGGLQLLPLRYLAPGAINEFLRATLHLIN